MVSPLLMPWAYHMTAVSPLPIHWRYYSLTLSCWYQELIILLKFVCDKSILDRFWQIDMITSLCVWSILLQFDFQYQFGYIFIWVSFFNFSGQQHKSKLINKIGTMLDNTLFQKKDCLSWYKDSNYTDIYHFRLMTVTKCTLLKEKY